MPVNYLITLRRIKMKKLLSLVAIILTTSMISACKPQATGEQPAETPPPAPEAAPAPEAMPAPEAAPAPEAMPAPEAAPAPAEQPAAPTE
ncbi:MAG: hypothetical protein HY541_02560 [Deltaproteobacteria bacterium]|nr:hypothetical protein [Deltaproteobacteria bacterium]